MNEDDGNIWIKSGYQGGKAVCELQYGTTRVTLTPEVTLVTARDLHAAAARAEDDIALIKVLTDRVKLDLRAVGLVLGDVRTRRPMLTGKPALRIEAVAGHATGEPYVHIARGSMSSSLSPDDARQMALHWTEAAVAAQLDARLRYVLGDFPHITEDDLGRIFAGMQDAGGGPARERTP